MASGPLKDTGAAVRVPDLQGREPRRGPGAHCRRSVRDQRPDRWLDDQRMGPAVRHLRRGVERGVGRARPGEVGRGRPIAASISARWKVFEEDCPTLPRHGGRTGLCRGPHRVAHGETPRERRRTSDAKLSASFACRDILAPRRLRRHPGCMSKKPAPNVRASAGSRRAKTQKSLTTYGGVRLPPLSGRSRFSQQEIERAVDAAIKKNPDAFTRKV